MKFFLKLVVVFTMFFCYFGKGLTVHAYDIDPYEADIQLYGSEITERVVMYDSTINHVSPFELVPGVGTGINYMTFFSKVEWIKRSGVWSLSLTPREAFFDYNTAWNHVKNEFKNDTQWANSGNSTVDSSMYNQYVCHYKYAGTLKTPWNLEPSRVDKGYSNFVSSACN